MSVSLLLSNIQYHPTSAPGQFSNQMEIVDVLPVSLHNLKDKNYELLT